MSPLPRIAAVLVYISSLAWSYLYLYPIWHGCGFPQVQLSSEPRRPPLQFPFFQHDNEREAPFRLLILADPQLEGDTSLPEIDWSLSTLEPTELLRAGRQSFKFLRKKLDLWGNDRYLSHIYRSLQTFTYPTHVTVLGDLLGSQWISDEEFERRADRFWNVVFAGSNPVPEYLTRQPLKEDLGFDKSWKTRVISVAGNHDVGYAGDMTEERLERFERRFGKSNWELNFELSLDQESGPFDTSKDDSITRSDGDQKPPKVRIMVLNSMNLDTPALSQKLQDETYASLNNFLSRSESLEESENVLTIVLTHVPLYKKAGVCVDGPFFNFHSESEGGGVKEQNHLSEYASRLLLEGVFGISDGNPGRNGVILTGHDHEGCDIWHFLPSHELTKDDEGFKDHRWNATRWNLEKGLPSAADAPGIREVTLRSMMGEFDGNAALLSAWYDKEAGKWGYDVMKCAIGSQHIWWAVHVLFVVTLGIGAFATYEWQAASIQDRSLKKAQAREKAKELKKRSVRVK